jgi:uncharacterized protein YbbC (DUF1343 family)
MKRIHETGVVREGTRRFAAVQYGVLLLAVACARGSDDEVATAGTVFANRVRPGIDVLLDDSLRILDGSSVGLITNQTGLTSDGRTTIDALNGARGVHLVALFSPEHGIRGSARPGEAVGDSIDTGTGLPIRSLYGDTRKPTAAMLADIDALVFDIQDIGARYYTYVSTMALAMQAAAENHRRFIVLDRPNPIGGVRIGGNVLDTAYASFVGMYPVPMRHGMTVGEIARMLNTEFDIHADLHVIPMAGWRRDEWFDETGLPWVAPSPNMPDIESAGSYPGTCLFEGTNLSVGRGTDRAFQQIGAPWLDADALVRALEAVGPIGVRFEVVRFTPSSPSDGKYDGQAVNGVRFIITDRATYEPTRVALATLIELQRSQPSSFAIDAAGFDRLAGTDALRRAILGGASADSIAAGWRAQLDAFETIRSRYLLYD